MKRMLINATQKEELRVALVDGQRLYDLDIEIINARQKKSNIYKGKITQVEPSLEAVFVDYGAEKHGFLPIKEISKEYFSGSTAVTSNGKPDYKKLISENQEIMVQVEKEERGNKGAALTTYISLAGRYLVAMPNNSRGGGVSRRIQGSERRELLQVLKQIDIPKDVGVIVRTAGVGRNCEDLQWDLDYQLQVWQAISDAYKQSTVGSLLYQESNIIVRALRDYFRNDISQIIIDDENVYQQAYAFMSLVIPDKLKCLQLYKDELSLFTRHQIEAQIDSAYQRNVRLPSGGELVIDCTEAMVSIDVNSARSTKGSDVEETALNTNLEAAKEVARQLRLRDIGGLIVIDFIDMNKIKNRRKIEEKIKEFISIDRARVQFSRISKFGLLEMSRQRLRLSIGEASHSVCPRCKGQGSIRSTQSVALSVLRLIEEYANKKNTKKVIAQLPIKVATFLANEKRGVITSIEKINSVTIVIIANETLKIPNYDIASLRDDENMDNFISYQITKDFTSADEEDSNNKQIKQVHDRQEALVSNVKPINLPPKPKNVVRQLFKRTLEIFNKIKSTNNETLSRKKANNIPSKKQTKSSKISKNYNKAKDKSDNTLTKKEKPKVKTKSTITDKNKKITKPVKNKAFVNEYATDKSKIRQGRPVSEKAVRGAGKKNADKIKVETTKPTIKDANSKSQQDKSSNKNTKKAKVKRIYVPRAVSDATPALSINNNLEQNTKSTAKNSKNITDKNDSSNKSQANPIAKLSSFGQSVWYDNISRDIIESGELQQLIDNDDLRGITSNPAIFAKALAGNHPSYLSYLAEISKKTKNAKEAFFTLAIKDIREACQYMRKTYDKTDGTDGMVSLEVSPDIAHDANKTIDEALMLNQRLGYPNAMIKVPGTEQGLIAIEQLTYLGINVNVTLLFSVSRYIEVFKAYMRGLQKRAEMGLPVSDIRSVASFFVSRIDTTVDKILQNTNNELKGKVAIANARLAYDAYLQLLQSEQWQKLQLVNASPQRLLWASTGTKDPGYSDVLYVESLIGKDTVNTLPPATYNAFKDHGKVANTITKDIAEAKALIELLPQYGINLEAITQQLEKEGIAAFESSFTTLLSVIDEKMS